MVKPKIKHFHFFNKENTKLYLICTSTQCCSLLYKQKTCYKIASKNMQTVKPLHYTVIFSTWLVIPSRIVEHQLR